LRVSVAALDLNDACLALSFGPELLATEEGCALLTPAGLVFGAAARCRSRLSPLEFAQGYWREMSDAPLPRPLGRYRSSADLVSAHISHLQSLLPSTCEGVVLATPPYWGGDEIALLLGIAGQLDLRVLGMVDGAVAASRRPHPGTTLFQLEVTLDDIWLARIAQESGVNLIGRERIGNGMEAMRRRAAGYFAACFLATSRFDPTHDADAEQTLHNRLREWGDRLADEPEITMEMAHRGHTFSGVARSAELQAHMIAALEPLLRRLRAVSGPGQRAVLQVPAHLGEVPGLLEALAVAMPFDLLMLAPGEAARGALRVTPQVTTDGHRLVTELPWDQRPTGVPSKPDDGRQATNARNPTHLLHAGAAYRLGRIPLNIGNELPEGEFGVTLPAGVRGVSRQHCTIREESGRIVLHDHSRYGTSLNGHPVEGDAILEVGDRIAIGQPPAEFMLIAEVGPRGA
jgi:hypothetical protein